MLNVTVISPLAPSLTTRVAARVTVGKTVGATVTVVVCTAVLLTRLGSKVELPTVTVLVIAPVCGAAATATAAPRAGVTAASVLRLP